MLIAVPQSPDECGAYSPDQQGSGWSAPGERKYDWLAQPGTGDVDPGLDEVYSIVPEVYFSKDFTLEHHDVFRQ